MISKIECCDCGTVQFVEDLLDAEFVKCACTGGYHEFSVLEEDVELNVNKQNLIYESELIPLKTSIKNVQVIYNSNSNGLDSTECPMCNATGIVTYSGYGRRTRLDGMHDIKHYSDCPFILIDKFLTKGNKK